MKSAREWWESMVIPNNKTIAVCCIPDIEAIQKDAFDAGWNTGWKQGMEDSLDIRSKVVDPQRAVDAWKPDSQHNTPCSKKGENA